MDDMFKALLGRPLARVVIPKDGAETVVFEFLDGSKGELACEGDCCSHSWMEHLSWTPIDPGSSIVGAMIQRVDTEQHEPPWDNHVCPDERKYSRPCGHDHLQIYHVRFVTDRGDIVLEYRNDSNGYYAGYLTQYTEIQRDRRAGL